MIVFARTCNRWVILSKPVHVLTLFRFGLGTLWWWAGSVYLSANDWKLPFKVPKTTSEGLFFAQFPFLYNGNDNWTEDDSSCVCFLFCPVPGTELVTFRECGSVWNLMHLPRYLPLLYGVVCMSSDANFLIFAALLFLRNENIGTWNNRCLRYVKTSASFYKGIDGQTKRCRFLVKGIDIDMPKKETNFNQPWMCWANWNTKQTRNNIKKNHFALIGPTRVESAGLCVKLCTCVYVCKVSIIYTQPI